MHEFVECTNESRSGSFPIIQYCTTLYSIDTWSRMIRVPSCVLQAHSTDLSRSFLCGGLILPDVRLLAQRRPSAQAKVKFQRKRGDATHDVPPSIPSSDADGLLHRRCPVAIISYILGGSNVVARSSDAEGVVQQVSTVPV